VYPLKTTMLLEMDCHVCGLSLWAENCAVAGATINSSVRGNSSTTYCISGRRQSVWRGSSSACFCCCCCLLGWLDFFRQGLLCSPTLTWNSLCSPGWPPNFQSSYLSLPNAGIIDAWHHAWFCIFPFPLC
jgi:hypothetical protein